LKRSVLADVLIVVLVVFVIAAFLTSYESYATYGAVVVLGVLILLRFYGKNDPKPGEQMNF
jgi:hypothetical protein